MFMHFPLSTIRFGHPPAMESPRIGTAVDGGRRLVLDGFAYVRLGVEHSLTRHLMTLAQLELPNMRFPCKELLMRPLGRC